MKPRSLEKLKAIRVNADAPEGKLWVELLDADGYRVPGFTREDAVAIQGNGLRHEVAWQDKRLEDLPTGIYMLRIHLDRASLFAIELVAE